MQNPIVPVVNAVTVIYSQINQAYFVMWHSEVLSVHNSKEEAIAEYNRILSGKYNASFVPFK